MTDYCKSENGLVHLVSAANPEFTLCGDAFDNHEDNDENRASWKNVAAQPVTCEICLRCIAIVERHLNRSPKPRKKK